MQSITQRRNEMTTVEFLIEQRNWACRWLDTPVDQLPGTLTHEKAFAALQEAEDKLIEFERYTADGRMHYASE